MGVYAPGIIGALTVVGAGYVLVICLMGVPAPSQEETLSWLCAQYLTVYTRKKRHAQRSEAYMPRIQPALGVWGGGMRKCETERADGNERVTYMYQIWQDGNAIQEEDTIFQKKCSARDRYDEDRDECASERERERERGIVGVIEGEGEI